MQPNDSAAAAPVSPLSIALGSVPLDVTYRDGTSGRIQIQLHEPENYPDYLEAMANNYRLAEFAAKQPQGWGETLHPLSLMEIVERSLDLNFHLVRRWGELRTRLHGLVQDLDQVVPASSRSPKPSA